jgi:hypothetical protein
MRRGFRVTNEGDILALDVECNDLRYAEMTRTNHGYGKPKITPPTHPVTDEEEKEYRRREQNASRKR